MIAATAIALALAFWTPAGEAPPCPQGLTIEPIPAVNPFTGVEIKNADGWAVYGAGCRISLGPQVDDYPPPMQCAVIAHELGHSLRQLPDLPENAENIMNGYTSTRPIPGICYGAPRFAWRPSPPKRLRAKSRRHPLTKGSR